MGLPAFDDFSGDRLYEQAFDAPIVNAPAARPFAVFFAGRSNTGVDAFDQFFSAHLLLPVHSTSRPSIPAPAHGRISSNIGFHYSH